MFGRRKQQDEASNPESTELKEGGKGHPTPSRKEQEARRKQPLVPADRKAAGRANRERTREMRAKQDLAMRTGDERYLPPRDKGPTRRFVRDYVDSRRSISEWMMIILIVMILAILLGGAILPPQVAGYSFIALYAVFIVVGFDAFWRSRLLKRAIIKKFGHVERGALFYGVMRFTQLRRTRLPKPQVQRGEFPDRPHRVTASE